MKYLIAFVLFLSSVHVWAVPDEVRTEVTQYPIVHQGACEWREMVVPCQVFYNEAFDTVYLVIFTLDLKDVTHVVKVTDTTEEVLWANQQYNI